VLDVAHVGTQHEAVLARDAVALDDLGRVARGVGDVAQLPGRGPDTDDGAEAITERPRVHVGVVAADHAVALEAAQPLGDGRRREPDAAPELREGDPGVGLELGQKSPVRGVQ
jgi:hypothetical protein